LREKNFNNNKYPFISIMDNDFDCNSSKIFFIIISIEYEIILQQYLIGNGIKFYINWYIFSRIKKIDRNLHNKENLSLSFIQKINKFISIDRAILNNLF